MENGYDDEKLTEKFSGLAVTAAAAATPATTTTTTTTNNNNNDSLFQVMKAVEAAEATIRQLVEENTGFRNELHQKILELDRYKADESAAQRPRPIDAWNDRIHGSYEAHQPFPSIGNQEDKVKSIGNASMAGPPGPLALHPDLKSNSDAVVESPAESHSESSKVNGTLRVFPAGTPPADNTGFTQFPSPSTTSFSPGRYQMEGEYDPRFNLSGHGLIPMADINNSGSLWKQDLIIKIREHEEEIMQLRKHLADYSVKEAHIRNEKYLLEKRIAYMRLAFDQQQQDLVEAASKALSYRQDIIEENIRLTYALQDAQQERSTFVSSLLPLLAEYSLQPPVPDAQSIVSNVKVLFKHLQEKLLLTESKLKESQYQLAPWRSDVNHSNFAPQSPSHPIGAALTTSNKNGLELVPQPSYSHGKIPVSSDAQTATDWELSNRHQSGLGGAASRNPEPVDLGRYPPLASR